VVGILGFWDINVGRAPGCVLEDMMLRFRGKRLRAKLVRPAGAVYIIKEGFKSHYIINLPVDGLWLFS
jgi:hypothetical protein